MFKLLWGALVLATAPFPAQSGFIFAGIGSVISTVAGWLAAGGVTGFLANAALSMLVSAVATKLLTKKADQQDIFRELQEPKSLPVHRFVYGKGWAPGTPAPVRVKGSKLYACYILNSRPSQGPFTLILDKRQVISSGNPFDFSGPGAQGTNGWFTGEHVRYWIGRGDQMGPPDRFVTDAPEFFQATDRWRGLTVLWAIFDSGKDEDFNERWPAAPPEVMVDGHWSKVWDPRDPSQDPNDESTWLWSNNAYLCALDALRKNPVRPYPIEHLWVETFSWAADVADSPLPVKDGGTIPRFRADGVLAFDEGSELEDQVGPLLAAGAGRWLRAYGQLGVMPAVYTDPVGTITEVLSEQDMVFETWRPGDQLYTEAYATITSPDRAYESATTPTYKVAGAEAADGTGPRPLKLELPFVHDHRQGQYICKIEVMRTRMQKSMSFLAPPETINFLSGANVTLNLPAPYTSRNGVYKIEESSPNEDPMGLSGEVALRNPMSIREESPAIYSWNPATEEQDMEEEVFDFDLSKPAQPSSVSVSTGAGISLTSGDASFPQIRFIVPRPTEARVVAYDWVLYYSYDSGGENPHEIFEQRANGTIRIEEDDLVIEGFSGAVVNGARYRIGVTAVTRNGSRSDQRMSDQIIATVGASLTPPPTPVSAVANAQGITVTYLTPSSGTGFSRMEIYGANVNNIDLAALIFGPLAPGVNTEVARTETGLSDGQTRYYWARSIDNRGIASAFSSVMSATYEEP